MSKTSQFPAHRGFALVATLSLMVLLAILAVGLLSLSAVTLRSSGQGAAQAEARANARMALMVAIGELQKQMGPDQRISANADILSGSDVNHPHWAGVWDSWIAGPLPETRNPNYPSAPSHQQTIGSQPDDSMRPAYARKNDHFRSWLVSLKPSEAIDPATPETLSLTGEPMPGKSSEAVLLVGPGSLGTSAVGRDSVSARLLPVMRGSAPGGRYGWWVGDESQKARITNDSYHGQQLTNAQKIFRSQVPGSTGTSTLPGFGNMLPSQQVKLDLLPSLGSVDLVPGISQVPVGAGGVRASQGNFHDITLFSHKVLADVREGGMKRDLSAILERVIDPSEVYNIQSVPGLESQFRRAASIKPASSDSPGGDEFMLYRFDDMSRSFSPTGEAGVPIQDLAAYYQLYDHQRDGWKGGIQFSSQDSSPPNNLLGSGVMVSNPDYGETKSDYDNYLRQHSAIYRSVYPVKIEFIASYITEPILPVPTDPNADKYRLRIGFTPAVTFWNPNNVPVVMNKGNPDRASIMFREHPAPLQLTFTKSAGYNGSAVGDPVTVQLNRITANQQSELYTLFISGNNPTVFQPGETKVFSMRHTSGTDAEMGSSYVDYQLRGGRGSYTFSEAFQPFLEIVPGWNPDKFTRPNVTVSANTRRDTTVLTFKETDYISTSIGIGTGREFATDFTQKSRHGRNAPGVMWHYRSYEIRSRMFPGGNPNFMVFSPYRTSFISAGIPPLGNNLANTAFNNIVIPPRRGQILVDSMRDPMNPSDDLPQAFFYYGMKAATEVHESNHATPAAGIGSGRRFPSRPFTHSTVMKPEFIDTVAGGSLYNIGWNWYFTPLNNLLDVEIPISRDNHGYYGGGYTAENGTTHVVQQELPVTAPISIASLSHAHLSGYSLSSEGAAAGYNGLQNLNASEAFRRNTALGFGGLAPRTLQAIGNSYAHPNIPKDKAITTWNRVFFQSTATPVPTPVPFADHSYLANKALWDDFFFSSITPVPADNPIYGSSPKSVADVANGFFFSDEPLPNRRMLPYAGNLDRDRLAELVGEYETFKGGFADKIAANLMVEGPFNVNSTSVRAWKTLFSSLKGKPVSYLDTQDSVSNRIKISEHTPEGVPVSMGSLPNDKPHTGSSSDPSDVEQWRGSREITDKEIDELAQAMVGQVRLRGPFLSLSEFINRRLDPNSAELSLRGALQAAIDDEDCTINAGFRNDLRRFSNRESAYVGAVFPEAAEGPIAYGSAAYVDQADILRNLGTQLTARGDTFVIRAYGDSLDVKGNVLSRAWCEAVVQRVPDYVDPRSHNDTSGIGDTPETKQSELTSDANRAFGREIQIIAFRWLNPSEI